MTEDFFEKFLDSKKLSKEASEQKGKIIQTLRTGILKSILMMAASQNPDAVFISEEETQEFLSGKDLESQLVSGEFLNAAMADILAVYVNWISTQNNSKSRYIPKDLAETVCQPFIETTSILEDVLIKTRLAIQAQILNELKNKLKR